MKNIWQDKSGNFGILSALLMVPLIGAAGVALDVTHGMAVKSDLQMAADAFDRTCRRAMQLIVDGTL